MPRILLIDDDEIVRDTMARFLTFHGYEFAGTGTGREAIRLARDWNPDVALVDFRLPDMSGFEVLAELAVECPTTAGILFTGYATLEVTIQAMRLGSCDCVTKPALQQDILEAVERALVRQPRHTETATQQRELTMPEAHAAVRWAEPIDRLMDAKQDPRTLQQFARATGTSVGGFRNWCRTACLKSRASLDFARGLRAVYLFERDHFTRPENLLDIVDRRTIAKFVEKSGGQGDRLPDSVTDFLDRQQFITNREAVQAIRTALAVRRRQSRATEISTAQGVRETAADQRSSMTGSVPPQAGHPR